MRRSITKGKAQLAQVVVPDAALERAARIKVSSPRKPSVPSAMHSCAARSLAALEGDDAVGDAHLRRVAPSALRHRLRRNPLDDAGSTVRVDRAVAELFGG